VPGTVSEGHLIQAPGLGWSDVDIAGALTPPCSLGVLVDNDATFSAIGEARRGASRNERSVVHVYMDNGIGGALLEDGRVIGGAQGIAGEFGHMPFGSPDAECRCGAFGCWNTAVEDITPAAATALGRGAAALVNGFDPAIVCLGGLAVDLRAIAPDKVDAAYRRGLMSGRLPAPPPIVDGQLGERGPLVGAAEHGFDALLTDQGLTAWSTR
jgi:predicted NBD/HSP70 family sugar kinase